MINPTRQTSLMPNSSIQYNYNPCREFTPIAKDYFSSCVSFLDNSGTSLYKALHMGGYTSEDLRDLIMYLYDVEDLFGEIVGSNSTEVATATRVLSYIERSFEQEVLVPPDRDNQFDVPVLAEPNYHKDIIEALESPLESVPLLINGPLVQKAIAEWRLKRGK